MSSVGCHLKGLSFWSPDNEGDQKMARKKYMDEKIGILKLKQDVENLPQVKQVIYSGDLERVNKKWVGPGFYFPSGFKMNGHVPVYLIGANNRGYGERANIFPRQRTDALLNELIGFRLDGYGTGAVSSDARTVGLLEELEKMDGVGEIERRGIERRTEKWRGPGFYHVGTRRKDGLVAALVCGSKKIGAGLRVAAYVRSGYIDDLEYMLQNYHEEMHKMSSQSQYGNAIHL
jgi:hypothetical protein